MLSIATQNTKVTLSDRVAAACLEVALAHDLDVWNGQEWGPNRNDVLDDAGTMYVAGRRQSLARARQAATKGTGLLYVRHADGGPPMGLDPYRFEVRKVERVILAQGRKVRPQPGTRSVLDDNEATLVTAYEPAAGTTRRLLNFHLDAHVEDGASGSYRDPRDPRATMHRQERAAIVKLGVDYAAGDTNWHNLELGGLVSCWHGRKPEGTLGKRAIDTIYARGRHAAKVKTYGTPAREHRLVVAGYPDGKPTR